MTYRRTIVPNANILIQLPLSNWALAPNLELGAPAPLFSQRRRAAARKHVFPQRHVPLAENSGFARSQQRPLSQQEHIDRLTLIATLGRPLAE